MDECPSSKHKKFCEPLEDPVSFKFKKEKKIVFVGKEKENSKKVFKESEETNENKFKKISDKGNFRKINLKFDKTVSFLFSRPCCELVKLPKYVNK